MGVGGGAHTGLVGEQAALCTLADGGLEGVTQAAADDGVGGEGVAEDHSEGFRDVLNTADEQHQAAQQIDAGHDRHQLFGDGGDAVDAAQEDEAGDCGDQQADDPRGHVEGGGTGLADGVGLDHGAHEAQSQGDGDGEEGGQELAELVVKGTADVVDGAAHHVAIFAHNTSLLRQDRFGVDGGHAEEGDEPHPEQDARATHQDGAAGADDVAGTHLSGHGGSQSLEGAHTAGLLAAPQGEAAKHAAHALAQAAHLDEAGPDAVVQAAAHQHDDQDVVGQIGVGRLYQLQ